MSLNTEQKPIKREKRIVHRQKSSEKNRNKKFQQLYENYKTLKTKEECLRQKILTERTKKELEECSFSPKIIKNKNLYKKKPIEILTDEERKSNILKTKELLNTDPNSIDLVNRQKIWLENKNKKINHKIVEEAIKSVEGCVFKPEIKKINKKVISNLKIKSDKIVEKPESYINFVRRNQKFRDNKKNNQICKTINWQSPNKLRSLKYNDYDYTKHELTENSYLFKNKSNSNFYTNISNSVSNRSIKGKELNRMTKSIPISKLKLTNISNDELYSLIYHSEKEKIEKNKSDFSVENLEKLFGDKKQIYFKQAMDGLHNALINISLNDDDNEDDVNLNGNENKMN